MAKKTQNPGEIAAELAKGQLKAYSKRKRAEAAAVRDALSATKADHRRCLDAKDWRGAAEAHNRHDQIARMSRGTR